MSDARRLALEVLGRIEQGGAYANLVLPTALSRSDLDPRDRRFVTELVYGTTRMRRACDALIDRFITAPPDARTRTLLRLGAYQIHYTDVPPHAAVSETVGLASRRVRGFVNAVLRRVANTPMAWPSAGAELSYPDWIVDRLRSELGDDDAANTLKKMNEVPPVTERDDGYVQDEASQWVAAAVEASSGERIIDVAAAPGGKVTAIASTGAFVVASDVTTNRAGLIASNSERLGSSLATVVSDATRPSFGDESFDAVLIDAPCSGLGTLRRRADARWRIQPSDIDQLSSLQAEIIDRSSRLVKVGGRLVYSVCTLTAQESIDHRPPEGFELDSREPSTGRWRPYGSGWRVLPHDADTDGMVLIRYRRVR